MTVIPNESNPSSSPGDAPFGRVAPLIELRDLGVYYQLQTRRVPLKERLLKGRRGEKAPLLWALRHVDLQCHEGEVLGIVGHNGAGKSTLCMALTKILTPDEGHAIVRGRISTVLSLRAGMNKDLSGRANILLFASFLGIPRARIERRMDAIIDFSELGRFIDEPLRTYSTGMRARLAFSVATTLEPDILILDEIVSVGDTSFRDKSRARIRKMMRRSRLIVVVSHSTAFLREICTHCLWMERGTVRMHGLAGEVLDAYDESSGEQRERLAALPPPTERAEMPYGGLPAMIARLTRLTTAWLESPRRIRRCFASLFPRRRALYPLAVKGAGASRQVVFETAGTRYVGLIGLSARPMRRARAIHALCREHEVPSPRFHECDASSTALLKRAARSALWEYVDGVSASPTKDLARLAAIGDSLGRLHRIAPPPEDSPIPVMTGEASSSRWRKRIRALRGARELSEAAPSNRTDAWLERNAPALSGLPRPGLVHGNLHLDNLVFRGATATPIDLSGCAFGPVVFELAQVLWDFCGDDRERREAFLDAYRAQAPEAVMRWWDTHAAPAMILGQLHAAEMCLASGRRQTIYGSRHKARDRGGRALSAWMRFHEAIETFPDRSPDLDELLKTFRSADEKAAALLREPVDPAPIAPMPVVERIRPISAPPRGIATLSRWLYRGRYDQIPPRQRAYLATLERWFDSLVHRARLLRRRRYRLAELKDAIGKRRHEHFRACPVCGNEEARQQPLFRPKCARAFAGAGGRYTVVRCTDCHALFRNPAVKRRHLKLLATSGEMGSPPRRAANPHQRGRALPLGIRAFSPLLDEGAGRTLLDIGCVEGDFLRLASARGFDARGLSASPAAVERMNRELGATVAVQGSLRHLPDSIARRRFDVITLWGVLPRHTDPIAALTRLRELLAPAGTALLTMPNADSALLRRSRARWSGFRDADTVFFTRSTFDRAARSAGFQAIEFRSHFDEAIEDGSLAPERIERLKRIMLRSGGGDALHVILRPS